MSGAADKAIAAGGVTAVVLLLKGVRAYVRGDKGSFYDPASWEPRRQATPPAPVPPPVFEAAAQPGRAAAARRTAAARPTAPVRATAPAVCPRCGGGGKCTRCVGTGNAMGPTGATVRCRSCNLGDCRACNGTGKSRSRRT
jgi:hypothetical protein